jgi:hypothetical protein
MLEFMLVFNKILDGCVLMEVQLDHLVGGIEREMAAAIFIVAPALERFVEVFYKKVLDAFSSIFVSSVIAHLPLAGSTFCIVTVIDGSSAEAWES